MAGVRLNKPPKSSIKLPKTHDEWHSLMVKAMERASKTKDKRLNGMQAALTAGQTEAHLRKLGIICMADVLREFPDTQK